MGPLNPREKKRNGQSLSRACYYSGKYFGGCKSFSIKAKMLILFISSCLGDAAAPFLIRESVLRQNKTVKLMPQSKKSKKKKENSKCIYSTKTSIN
jgi:hypothetical protein